MRTTAVFALILLAAVSGGQTPLAPPPGATGSPSVQVDARDACTVEGIVVDAATGAGLRNVEVSLGSAPGSAPAAQSSYTAATEKDGKFSITGVAPGAYRLSARRAGYLQTEYGARGSGRQGTTLTLLPGQRMAGLEVRLRRGAAISGRVVDEYGDPVERVMVRALRYRWTGSERQMSIQASTSTDDLGNYRLFGLEPGRYYLQVTPGVSSTVAAGQVGKLARLAYAPVYYPGTIDESAASPVEVSAGAELTSVNFTLVRAPAYRVTAQVLNSTGATGRIMGMLRPRQGSDPGNTRITAADLKTGRIDIQGVIPGSYLLMAGMSEGGKSYMGILPVEVTDRDLTNITITLDAGYEIPGEVRLEDSDAADLSGVRVLAVGPATVILGSAEGSTSFGTRAEAKVASDGKFTLSGVFPDASQLSVTGLPDGFYVRAIQLGDRDVLESGLDLTSGPPAGPLRIVLSGKAGTVSGTVTAADGKPAAGATVVLIPKSEKRRTQSRFYKFTTTNQSGQFTLKNVDPGEYRVCAWEDVETMAWMDPEFLKPYENKMTALSVEPGARAALQLTAIPAP
ncbi:MAG: carboxypeptidase-like regulatory domain-containing protein [Bryobacteraceae bacterium]|nr:carboxypeptidase-like regulatory domain-containing protein [Bryobacteraceae bacterium]